MKKGLSITIIFLAGFFSSNVLAWGTIGHRVIAEIAQRNLDSVATANVNEILDNQCLAYWSNWPDYIKSDTLNTWRHTYVWHYVNAPANMNKSDFITYLKQIKEDNVYSEIPKLEKILKSFTSSKEDKKYALAFLIHLVGDMHQPMHTGRPDDKGGNTIKVSWFGRETNLHSIWDSQLVDYEKYSYTEYATVLNVLTDEQKAELQEGELNDWMFDSHQIANRVYDITPNGAQLSYDYNFIVRPIVDNQLQKGGLRLAKILNNLW